MKLIKSVLLMTVLFGQVANASMTTTTEKLSTNKGYPYKNLIHKAQQVRIHYVEDDSQNDNYVNCRVEVNWADNERKTSQIRVTKSEFEAEPLASCLPRKLAKQYLADIYAD
ncbi:MAG: hypothetical protein HRT35_01230 [Algicola sp.]|nr:hypothetical protein [Algicola sp.]